MRSASNRGRLRRVRPPVPTGIRTVAYAVWRRRGRPAAHRVEHRVEVDDARGDPELAFDARLRQLAGDAEIAVHPHVAELILDDLEIPGGDIDVQPAELLLVDGEVAGDRQRLLVVVQHVDVGDVDAVRLELDPTFEIGIRDAGGLDREGGVLNGDRAVGMRIVGRAGDVDLCLQRALHVDERRGQPLHQPEVDGRAVDVEIEGVIF